ncbi:MAG: hypothetical protein H0U10_07470 [Chloroflexia bacterium]|nr:hypothetical protein [Chloroflexia bacterium]
MYDRTVTTSRAAIGAAAFDAARELGGASEHAEWIRSGEAVARAAAERVLDCGAGGRAAALEPDSRREPQPLVAAG